MPQKTFYNKNVRATHILFTKIGINWLLDIPIQLKIRKEQVHMSDIIKYQPRLPLVIQRHLVQQSQKMDYFTDLAMKALGEQGNVYTFAVLEVLRTMNTIVTLRQAFAKDGLDPEIEALVGNLTQNYLEKMGRIPQHASEMIIQVLEQASTPPDDGGLLGALLEVIRGHLNQ
jgi:hypothetical protein